MKIAILGFAGQGRSAYRYWSKPENEITICDFDAKISVPQGAKAQLGEDYLKNLDRFDLLVRTPALHPTDIVRANPDAPDILRKVWTNTNEFFKVCPSRNIIGVTGTKGKGTTSTLIANMLEAAGKTVHLGGNIGIPPLEMLHNTIQPNDWVVLELANFQLIDLQASPPIAVCLMVVPEHMDWHADMKEYVTAKQQLFLHQKSDNVAIYYAGNTHSKEVVSVSQGQKIPYYTPPGAFVDQTVIRIADQAICRVDELKLLGQHNWQNVCAAVTAVWQVTQDIDAMRKVLTTFSGLEHRLELVREIDGVTYYDDSFGTAPETAIVAIQAFERPKVVILGGSDKGASYEKLARTIKESNVRQVILIGNTTHPRYRAAAPDIADALKRENVANITSLVKPGGSSMAEIVTAAQAAAQPGDVVLLSAGCASFDMFANYKDRGEQFKAAVQALA